MVRVAIAFGSNMGDRVRHLAEAMAELGPLFGASRPRISPVYETAPMYVVDQPAFLNGVMLAETSLSPRALLAALKGIENRVGRLARDRNGPREIDLDLVAYGSAVYSFYADDSAAHPSLRVPHPRLAERRFVLQPLHDLNPGFVLPGLPPLKVLLAQTEDQRASVLLYEDAALSL
ncbi:MAG TPA: 2-amino-4-hydroxy-6-hydroxymethyldihydropteridine diphosphokinase [Fimbriimonadaceae bacterium]|nr:2-amino-4-hydroxy-6-hydroxymethyldihydropteridine diphosphokinase [Fimbriimonadaceae bacterium]HRJ95866.1 2-amino-4-hydroxy-6-hydroxymethyldihydropteridine diphosphokinase [Fimbriimonadaceae bacterium]